VPFGKEDDFDWAIILLSIKDVVEIFKE